jgi:hypothetical protein
MHHRLRHDACTGACADACTTDAIFITAIFDNDTDFYNIILTYVIITNTYTSNPHRPGHQHCHL